MKRKRTLLVTGLILLGLAVSPPTLAGVHEDARALMNQGKWDEARATLEPTLSNASQKPRSLELLTEICNAQQNHKDGVKFGKEAVKAAPDSSNAHLQYAVAVRIKMSNVSIARAMFSIGGYKKSLATAIELDPTNIDALDEQIGYYLNAPGVAGGSVEKARELARELAGLDERQGNEWLARIELNQDNIDGAIPYFEKAIALDPEGIGLRFEFGYAMQRAERWELADEQFALIAAGEHRRAAEGLYQRGRTRILGKYEGEQAVAFLQKYIDEAPDDAQPSKSAACWRLGNAYELLGRKDEAGNAYRTALQLDPDNDEARKALKQLQ